MPELYVGLMSGTSLDGIDAAVADFGESRSRLLHSHYQPFQPQLRETLLALQDSGRDELHRAAVAANQLSHAYAAAVRTLLAQAALLPAQITAVGCHGQTVRHRPDTSYTIQLVNGALLAELTGISVACDFRSRDIAAGGQGAPLVPAFHRELFHDAGLHRAIVNIGGIANVTDLPPSGPVTGFDCGPGNLLLDAWIADRLGKAYDEHGAWATQGKVLPALLDALLAHDFFRLSPPKSTGRDTFNLAWLKRALTGSEADADVQATLLELTATGIARAIDAHCSAASEVFLCGGGARNRALAARLRELMPGRRLDATDALGVDAEWLEALAFAWLARRTVRREPGNLPSVTGAQGPRVLGAIYAV
ncbi:MAG: anhydro-N-acetylmuramic acid kinase [Burkholderiales bacterium]|nr:anhydro-N-acetylmuramic acid kinase [Burkholderiales bacterium]